MDAVSVYAFLHVSTVIFNARVQWTTYNIMYAYVVPWPVSNILCQYATETGNLEWSGDCLVGLKK